MQHPPRNFADLLVLEPHGPDTYVGVSPQYDWGRIYGGQVIAQGLWAASDTVADDRPVHSLHAYFILGGRLDEPVRYEVDRLRTGRSFVTRSVVARQSYGAILNLSASFHEPEDAPDVITQRMPVGVPDPDDLEEQGWGYMLNRRQVPFEPHTGRVLTWVRVDDSVGEDPVSQACALAFASDTSAVTALRASHPAGGAATREQMNERFMGASLDHAVWFHRPFHASDWILIDMQCHGLVGARGLSIGQMYDRTGTHIASVVQEALLRERRTEPGAAGGDISGT